MGVRAVSVRQDFVDAYVQTFPCSKEFADSLLRQLETDYADQENRQLQDLVDTEAVRHMQSQDMDALRKQIDDWKAWEASARGAAIRLVNLLGRPDLMPFLQAGQYDEAVAMLGIKTEGEG